MSVRSSERGVSLFEAILAIAVFVIGLGGGLFWLALITDTDEDKRLAENVGALVEGLEAYTKDNWGPLQSAGVLEDYYVLLNTPYGTIGRDLISYTAWVPWNIHNRPSQEGEKIQEIFYGLPWRVLKHYMKGDARNLSPVAEVDSPLAQDSCYQFVRDIPSAEDAPCVWLEGNGDNGIIALFNLERRTIIKGGKRVLLKDYRPDGAYSGGGTQENLEGAAPLRAIIRLFYVYSTGDPIIRVNEVNAAITEHLSTYYVGRSVFKTSVSNICRRRWVGGSLASNCTGNFRFMAFDSDQYENTIVSVETPVQGPVNWDLRIRDLAAEGEEDEDPGS